MNTLSRWNSKNAGFTLIEILVALAIIAITCAYFFRSTLTSSIANNRAKVYMKVSLAVQEAIETVQTFPLPTIKTLNNTDISHSQGTGIKVVATSRNVTSADVADSSELNILTLQHLTLLAKFKGINGDTATKQFTTIVYKPE